MPASGASTTRLGISIPPSVHGSCNERICALRLGGGEPDGERAARRGGRDGHVAAVRAHELTADGQPEAAAAVTAAARLVQAGEAPQEAPPPVLPDAPAAGGHPQARGAPLGPARPPDPRAPRRGPDGALPPGGPTAPPRPAGAR